MRLNYIPVVVMSLLCLAGQPSLSSQTTDLVFQGCADTLTRLCVQDEGVRLPESNQIFLGEGHPDATRGSVHIMRTKSVSGGCGQVLSYKVELWSEDSTVMTELKSWTDVPLDTAGTASLFFDTAFSPDSITRHSGISYNSNCASNYTLVWTVTDSCGMEVSCSEDLHLYDCSAPEPGTFTGPYTAILPIGCFLTLFAKDFGDDSVDDHQTLQQMLFSFQQHSYTPSLTVLCQYDFGVELPWTIWIADKGEDLNCNGNIEWHERNKVQHDFIIVILDNGGGCCEPDFDSTLIGYIFTIPDKMGINLVTVELTRPGHVFPTSITSLTGQYIFDVPITGEVTTITPRKNIGHKNGVTTLDLVRLQKHLLGRQPFTSPDQFISADINHSLFVSAIDLIELRKFILGVYSDFPNNVSWRFAAKEPGFVDSLGWIYYEPSITFTSTLPDQSDFYGIKIGDVNYTANPSMAAPILPRSMTMSHWTTPDQAVKTGESVMVPLSLVDAVTLLGFQFTLEFPGFEFVAIHPGAIAPGEADYALFDDRITMSWFDVNGTALAPDDALFYLELKALIASTLSGSLALTSAITTAEMYVGDDEIFQPLLRFKGTEDKPTGLHLVCSPNPWKDQTDILITLASDEAVSMSLYDIAGRQVWAYNETLSAGTSRIPLLASDIRTHGPMILEVSTTKERVMQKMIVLE